MGERCTAENDLSVYAADRRRTRLAIEDFREAARLVAALLACILVFDLAGCAPKVKFTSYVRSADNTEYERVINKVGSQTREAARPEPGAIDFFLRGSTIVIAIPEAGGGSPKTIGRDDNHIAGIIAGMLGGTPVRGSNDLENAKATVAPLELNERLYRAIPNESFLYSPNISVAYEPATLLPTSIGADSVERGARLLQVVGAVVAVAGIKGVPEPEAEALQLPVLIDVRSLEFGKGWKRIPRGCKTDDAFHDCKTWWYQVDRAEPDIPSEDLDEFFKRQPDWSREFPYAVCQDIWLTISQHEACGTPRPMNELPRFRLRIAHPLRVRSYLIPQKGQIKFNEVCGADIAVESTDKNTLLDNLQALADAVKQVKDARSAGSSQD